MFFIQLEPYEIKWLNECDGEYYDCLFANIGPKGKIGHASKKKTSVAHAKTQK